MICKQNMIYQLSHCSCLNIAKENRYRDATLLKLFFSFLKGVFSKGKSFAPIILKKKNLLPLRKNLLAFRIGPLQKGLHKQEGKLEVTKVVSCMEWWKIFQAYSVLLTLQPCGQKLDTCANCVDPDETANNEQSHQALHCLPFCF